MFGLILTLLILDALLLSVVVLLQAGQGGGFAALGGGGGTESFLQCGQSLRTRRWATTPMMLPAMMSGSTPMSSRRGMAPSAELVCRVEYT